MFAHSAEATARVLAATACGLPRWAKLSPNVPDVVEIAAGARRGRRRRADPGQHAARPGPRHRVGPPRPRRRRGRALGARRAPGGGAGRLGVPGGVPRAAHRRRGRCPDRPRRGRAAPGGRRRRAGGHGHLPRPEGTVEGAAPAGAVVRRHGTTVEQIRQAARDRSPRRAGAAGAGGPDTPASTVHRCTKEDTMADSFGDRVAAAVRADGPAVRRHRSVGALLGAWGLRDDADGTARVLCASAWRRSPARWRWSSRRSPSSSATARRAWRSWSGSSPTRRRPASSSSPTPSAATSTRRPRPTPTPGSVTPARWRPTP